jgi:carbon storage regulator CsrA
MLVLTRKTGERIVIAGVITVEVLHTQANKVQLGIEAPRGVSILRAELRPCGAPQSPAESPAVDEQDDADPAGS